MVVKYKDGRTKGIELGRRFGDAAGLIVPHHVTTTLTAGTKFKEGDVLSYNTGFFEKDMLDPTSVVWKSSVLVNTALMETNGTLEDSSIISPKVSKLLNTKVTKVKTVVISFNQVIHKLAKVGDSLMPDDILCIIEDGLLSNTDLFDSESIDTLQILSSQTPQAKTKGFIERIEVYYHGDKEDMSESVRTIANHSDHLMSKRHKSAGKKAFTGSVTGDFRVDGNPLAIDTMAIRFYITGEIPANIGDKGVFCNQMKTVFGEVMAGDVKTDDGQEVDAIFGYESINARLVNSPIIIGTTTALLQVIGKKAAAIYKA